MLFFTVKMFKKGTSLIVQWLRIHLPVQGMWVWSLPGWGTKIPHAVGQLSPHTTTTELACSRAGAPQLESLYASTTEPTRSGARTPQWKTPCAATKISCARASLVAQWLRICLLMQGTWVRALVWEDPTCRGASRPMSHSCWACASGACALQREWPR